MGIDRSNDIAVPKPEINMDSVLRIVRVLRKAATGSQAESSVDGSRRKIAVDMSMSISGMGWCLTQVGAFQA
jgi:hypothetical protein